MELYIVGEDEATRTIIYKIIEFCQLKDVMILSDLPARGGKVKQQIANFNNLSARYPVVLLTDLDDAYCPPSLIQSWHIGAKNANFIINIAIDEAEAWLMADRENFSKYFQVDIDLIPCSKQTKLGGRKWKQEMCFPYKPSLYLTQAIIPHSHSKIIKQQMLPLKGAVKGKEYNAVMTPFIQDYWDINRAMTNSDSLTRMVNRIKALGDN